MWTRADLKADAKIVFQRHYWPCVLASILCSIMTGGVMSDFGVELEGEKVAHWIENASVTVVKTIIVIALVVAVLAISFNILIGNQIRVGNARYYMENRVRETKVSRLFFAFKNGRYSNNVWVMFLYDLYIFGWTLLLIVPGIIKSFEYMLVPYLLAENPNLERKRVFELSRQMMDGHKKEAFVLGFSFFGWMFLSAFTMGVLNTFYVAPYMEATYAEYYMRLRIEAIQNGIADMNELPGFAAENI